MNIPSHSNDFNKFNKAVLKSEVSLGEYLVPRPPLQLPTILISLLYLIHSVMLCCTKYPPLDTCYITKS